MCLPLGEIGEPLQNRVFFEIRDAENLGNWVEAQVEPELPFDNRH